MPLEKKNFFTTSVSITSFFPLTLIKDATTVIRALPANWLEIFDREPTQFPVPLDAPIDIPRLILKNSQDTETATFFRDRFSISRTLSPANEGSIPIDLFINDALNYIKEVKDLFSLKIGRIGYIHERACKVDDPAKELAMHFCKNNFIEDPFNRPENFELNSHKKYSINGINLNSWVKNRTASIKHTGESIIFIQQDINTLQEEQNERSFSDEEITKMIKIISSEIEIIFAKYYKD